MEGDATHWHILVQLRYFNPLPPHGGRHAAVEFHVRLYAISIHSLRMEGDDSCPVLYARPAAFQSTPSAWRETQHDIAEEETT